MPISSHDHLSTVIDLMLFAPPRSVLDVGLGYGVYGFLARSYLDAFGREDTLQLDGIEGFAQYIGEVQNALYDRIFVGDALAILRSIDAASYDLVLALDIVEHFDEQEASAFVTECVRVGRSTIVTTPRIHLDQDAVHGNELERHRSHTSRREFGRLGAAWSTTTEVTTVAWWAPSDTVAAYRRRRLLRQVRRHIPGVAIRVLRRIGPLKRIHDRIEDSGER